MYSTSLTGRELETSGEDGARPLWAGESLSKTIDLVSTGVPVLGCLLQKAVGCCVLKSDTALSRGRLEYPTTNNCMLQMTLVLRFYAKSSKVMLAAVKDDNEEAKKAMSLQDCLGLFSITEKLAETESWFKSFYLSTVEKLRIIFAFSIRYCPRCKEHKEATKKMEVCTNSDYSNV